MFVGRDREFAFLIDAVGAVGQRGAAVLVSGESGIGKTSLLERVRGHLEARGVRVAQVTAPEDAWQPPYATWESLFAQLGLDPLPLAAPEANGADAAEHRYRLHQHAIAALRILTGTTPAALILDDLQWLEATSRDLLLALIPQLRTLPLAIIGAWRTPLPSHDRGTAAAITTMLRDPAVQRLDLQGFTESDVSAVARALAWEAPAERLRAIRADTGGNPLFVTELVRFLRDAPVAGSSPAVPATITDVVQLRFSRLEEPTRQVLQLAAIFSSGFDYRLLREMSGLDDDTLLDAIDEAIAAAFLREDRSRPERYHFAHAIVRESLVTAWNPSRRARAHRRAAEAIERLYTGRLDEVAGDLALQYFASRSIEGAEPGIGYAMTAAERAAAAFNHAEAAAMLATARELALAEPVTLRAEIQWQLALALAESLQVDRAMDEARLAIRMVAEADAPREHLVHVCWRLGRALKDAGAPPSEWGWAQRQGLDACGACHDLHWARLMLLGDPVATVPNPVLYAARWLGFDREAVAIAGGSDNEEDVVQTIESFDARTPEETRALIARARAWTRPRATLRGLSAAANDLTYRHGEFRLALSIWNEVLALARRIGAVPWQANALNQMTLLHVTLGEFEAARDCSHRADVANRELGPANDGDALHMERDLALAHVLDGDWPHLAAYWLQFIRDPPRGFETQLAVPLYAAMAACAAAHARTGSTRAVEIIDALAGMAAEPGLQQANGVVAWAAEAVIRLNLADRAATFDTLAESLIAAGMGDYPQTSLHLSRARMLQLQGDPLAHTMFDQARETLAMQGQLPLLGIATLEQAIATPPGTERRAALLAEATAHFTRLGMTSWLEQAGKVTALRAEHEPLPAGITRREVEVLTLVAKGFPDRRIADELYVSERTVNAHVRNMLQKTGAGNRTELAAWAKNHRLVEG